MSAPAAEPHAWRLDLRTIVSMGILVAIALLLWFQAPSFFRMNNAINVLVQSSTLAILALGMAVVMIGGGIDLSLPANMALSAILGGLWMQGGGSPVFGVVIMLVAGTGVGFLNGAAVAYLQMIPFVVTLASMTVATGLSVWLTNSVSVSQFPEVYFDVLLARPLGLPVSVYVAASVTLGIGLLMSQTRFGRHVYAIGTSVRAARVARVPAQATLLASYALAGLMAGIAAVLLSARLGSASANMGVDSIVLDIVSAVVVGGISIYGGDGKPLGAVIGAIFITTLSNGLNLLGASFYLSLVVKGFVIIALIAIENVGGKRSP